MTNNLSNLDETLRAIDDINGDIKKIQRYIKFTPDGVFEEDAIQAYKNVLDRLMTIRHALEKKKENLEKS